MKTVIDFLTTFVTSAQTVLGLIAIVMLILFAFGVLYYMAAKALIGVWPALYQPVSGDWVKSLAVTWIIGGATFGALWAAITAAIAAGKYVGIVGS